MKKNYFYVAVLVSLLVSCISEKELTTISVVEKAENLTFYPNQVSKTLDSGLLVEISPISADSLNIEFGELSIMNGKYNFIARKSSRKDVSLSPKPKKSKEENRFEIAIKNLLDYCKEKNIDSKISDRLVRDFVNSYGGGIGISSLPKKINRNPYFIKDKYLSVYKLKLINPTSKILNLSHSDIHIVSGNESLRVFDNNDLISLNSYTEDKLLVLRKNLGSNLTIFPGDSIVKYVSTSALDIRNTKLNIYVEDKAFKYNAKHSVESKEIKYVYHHIHIQYNSFYYVNTFAYVIDKKGNVHSIYIEGKDLLIPDSLSGEKIIMFSYEKDFDVYKFGVKKDLDVDKLLESRKVNCPFLERKI